MDVRFRAQKCIVVGAHIQVPFAQNLGIRSKHAPKARLVRPNVQFPQTDSQARESMYAQHFWVKGRVSVLGREIIEK